MRAYYAAHHDKFLGEAARQQRREHRKKLRALVDAFKAKPCADCGESYPPYVMDLDHVRGTKVAHIARLVTRGSEARLRAELEKCEVVCANCHRSRTHDRRETL